jgi:hypothetical protein
VAQAVSRWHFAAESRFRARVSPCGGCSGHSATGTGTSPSSSVLTCIKPALRKLNARNIYRKSMQSSPETIQSVDIVN